LTKPNTFPHNRVASVAGISSYRTDETYIKVKGEDKYLYRAVDSTGQTIEFLLTVKRDAAARDASPISQWNPWPQDVKSNHVFKRPASS
jgi:hypothetical protein